MENSILETAEQTTLQVLCVDDEPAILRALCRVLMDEECEVLTATSGAEGLSAIATAERLALIISDQRMPEMTGVEFLQQAKQLCPAAYRVMLTGYADIHATMDAINHGEIWRYITKPWDDEQLILLVRDAIHHYNLESENQKLQHLVEKQNEELKQWNERLKQRVLAQTNRIREKCEELAYQNKSLRGSYEQTLQAFSCLIELRDKNLKNHTLRTAAIAEKAAQKLALPAAECKTIRAAALLHSIGKLGIPDDILCAREEDLSESERMTYNTFTVRGQTAIDSITELREAGTLIRHLLENFDGHGSPDQLCGTAIPVGSRIIALAEQIDRQLSAGCYGTLEDVIDNCTALAGQRFDPQLLPVVTEAARTYYPETTTGEAESSEELYPAELKTGMSVLRDVYSGTGILLLKQGSVLNAASIASLKRYYDTDAPVSPVLIRRKT